MSIPKQLSASSTSHLRHYYTLIVKQLHWHHVLHRDGEYRYRPRSEFVLPVQSELDRIQSLIRFIHKRSPWRSYSWMMTWIVWRISCRISASKGSSGIFQWILRTRWLIKSLLTCKKQYSSTKLQLMGSRKIFILTLQGDWPYKCADREDEKQ